jgi:hypothetical protein
MKDLLPEYIVAGSALEVSGWSRNASNAGILWCHEHERRRRNRCATSCLRGGGCGVVADSILLNVYPAESVSTFQGQAYEAILAIIPSKILRVDDIVAVRSLVLRLMASFHDSSVNVFESTLTAEGEVSWKPFLADQKREEKPPPKDRHNP